MEMNYFLEEEALTKTVLITGASQGIGYELAKLFAKDGYHLILVARSRGKLWQLANEMKQQYGTDSTILTKDLALPGAPLEILAEVKEKGLDIDILINNAGFGMYGAFAQMEASEIMNMIQVNITALTELTHLSLPGMISRKSGKIMNVASTAAFQPGPLMAVYYATKAYVLSFSEAIGNEVRPYGITVSALCPGPTDTGFEKRAKLEQSKLFQGVNMDAATVARIGYEGLFQAETIVIPGWKNRLLAFSVRFTPRSLITKIVRQLQETRK